MRSSNIARLASLCSIMLMALLALPSAPAAFAASGGARPAFSPMPAAGAAAPAGQSAPRIVPANCPPPPPSGPSAAQRIAPLEAASPPRTAATLATAPMVTGGAPSVFFSPLSTPVGVTVDGNGNIWTDSDAVFNTVLSEFSASGQVLQQIPLGNITSVGLLGQLATEPGAGFIWLLSNDGDLREFNPTNPSQMVLLGNLTTITTDASSVYDVASGLTLNMSAQILPSLSSYGDIAVVDSGTETDVFVAGISGQAIPYVLKLRWVSGAYQGPAKVLVASLAPSCSGVARGLAVSVQQRTVLTSLPIVINPNTIGVDVGVTFSADYIPGSGTTSAPRVILNQQDLASNGMTADSAGNFYVATGSGGSSLCGASGAGAIVLLPPDLSSASCVDFNQAFFDSRDVAVGPITNGSAVAYVTAITDTLGDGLVMKVPLTVGSTGTIGGKGFALATTPSGAVALTWTGGTVQTGYDLYRIGASGTTILGPLATTAVSYTDSSSLTGQYYCYVLAPLNGTTPLGLSDAYCYLPRTHAGTAPSNFAVQLNQSATATLTWTAPGGQSGYTMALIPLSGGSTTTSTIAGAATSFSANIGSADMCFVLIAQAGATVLGNSDALCALPGITTLTTAASIPSAAAVRGALDQLQRSGRNAGASRALPAEQPHR